MYEQSDMEDILYSTRTYTQEAKARIYQGTIRPIAFYVTETKLDASTTHRKRQKKSKLT
jgi:hypothetical protein